MTVGLKDLVEARAPRVILQTPARVQTLTLVMAAMLAGILLLAGSSWAQTASSTGPSFGKSSLGGEMSDQPTSLQFGPDGRLYVAELEGLIKAYKVERNSANSYSVADTEVINLIQSIPNHDDDGRLNTSEKTRQVTGILVAGSSDRPVIYVSSSDPRNNALAGTTGDLNLDTNSGVISKLSWDGSKWVKLDLVRGLPRSEESHSLNGMQLSADGNTLYVAAGGNTNQGAPSTHFALLPEYALSAAILKIDLMTIGNKTYNLATLDDDTRAGKRDANDPFGGNNGKNQATLASTSPVQVYAPGFRNAYDIVMAKNGKLYTIDNGGNAGYGNVPVGEGPDGKCTNQQSEPGQTNLDQLHLIAQQGYYGGHPNPTRGNRANTFNSNKQTPVPKANPIECAYQKPGSALTTFATSTNGLTEYTSSKSFGGAMQANLVAASVDRNVYRIQLNSAGDQVTKNEVLFSQAAVYPVDVTALGDNDPFPGTIWLGDLYGGNGGDIVVFEPSDYGGGGGGTCDISDPNGDADGDGYTNQDEQVNGTNPCSAADIPPDWDKDKISDKTDPDDDNDGRPDTSDPFAVDANNGLGTNLPVRYDFGNSTNVDGLLNMGFTGLMTNGTSDYQSLYDPNNLTAGGAAGVFTIDKVAAGWPDGQSNTAENGFQFGANMSSNSGVFTVHGRVMAPFAGITPQDYQTMGIFLGTGDQDNFLYAATASNGGQGGVKSGGDFGGQYGEWPVAGVQMPGPDYVDLYLTVDPAAKTAQASYAATTNGVMGPRTKVGGLTGIPQGWLDGSNALAVGIISTSGYAFPFSATWDFIEVVPGNA